MRDREFSARGEIHGAELLERLDGVVEEAARVLEKVTAERLEERVKIQAYDVTILEAVYHVVEHFSQHTGQILLMTKLAKGGQLGFYKHLEGAAHGERTP